MEIAISVGECLLSAALSEIAEMTASSDLLKFARKEKVEAEISKWHKKWNRLNAVLADAEQKQMSSKAVKDWLQDLKDVVYAVEDALDEFNYEALRCKLTANSQDTTSKVRALLPSYCTTLSPVISNVKLGSKLKKITTRLEEIVEEKNELALTENVGGKFKRPTEILPTIPLVDKSVVYGREDDKKRIVELLLGGEASTELGVIPIVGMGGLGKTTVAQLAYNDDKVNAHFAVKAWICVSEDFDIFRITKAIWQYVTSEPCQFDDIGFLQQELNKKLFRKKFLIVLDDVWNEKVDKWEALCNPLKTGVPGCKLLVTTRNDGVVSTTGEDPSLAYHLPQLSNEGCLLLLKKYAMGPKSFDEFPKLKEIGKKICRKCGGIPLAVKTLGGLLRNKQSPEEWEGILKSDVWDLPEEKNGILPALTLSYRHLPANLKRCFAYCSLLPKDYEFEKNELVSLWMAEGFLKGKKEMEDLGCEYFDELLSRSFVQQSSADETKYVMHDLVNDLAKVVAEQEKVYFWLDDKMKLCEEYNVCKKIRHSSFVISGYDVEKKFKSFSNVKRLRTFLALWKCDEEYPYSHLSGNVVDILLPKFKRLRALSLCHYAIRMLPSSIGNLKHLRYLNLSYCWIKQLPDSVEALYNLQTLILYGCWKLVELPRGIKNLIELHNLDITDTDKLQEMPSGIGALTKLQTLSKFIVGEGDGLRIRELKKLMHLRGQLSIYGLDKVKDIQDVQIANLKGKQRLDKLALVWSNEFQDSRNEQDEEQVLKRLEPSQNLKELEIDSYGGENFPNWLRDSLFVNMVRITFSNCKKCKALPSLGGMPSLKHLHIEGMNEVKRVDLNGGKSPSNKPFHNLETLTFCNMLGWVEWISQNVKEFSRLRELVIENCPNLTGNLPSYLPSLGQLEISNCPQLKSSRTMSLPSLVNMKVKKCDAMVIRSMVNLNSLTTLVIEEISGLSYLDQGLMESLKNVVDLQIQRCSELKYWWQNGEQPKKLPCVESEEPNTYGLKFLKKLEISYCSALKMLPDWLMLQGSNNDQCVVEELIIKGCPLIRSFPRGSLPTTLKRLGIHCCGNLECLPQGLMMHDGGNDNISCGLQKLEINRCGSLASFPPGKFSATLEGLSLRHCGQLESFTEGRFQDNPMLKKIEIVNYPNLNSLLIFGLGLGHFSYLAYLYLCNCPGLVSFPENVFLSTPNLKTLGIYGCEDLKSLPNQMHKNLTSLQYLRLSDCPGISFLCFPEEEGRLPPNLTSLNICRCKNMKQAVSEWGLNALTSLEYLHIWNGSCLDEIVSFPDDECLILPTSLTFLSIMDCKNMESLSRGLLNLTSLQKLFIMDCPKLRSLPKEGLPDSLGCLEIEDCKLIGERCIKEKKGDYWPLIAHIPYIKISHERERLTYAAGQEFN